MTHWKTSKKKFFIQLWSDKKKEKPWHSKLDGKSRFCNSHTLWSERKFVIKPILWAKFLKTARMNHRTNPYQFLSDFPFTIIQLLAWILILLVWYFISCVFQNYNSLYLFYRCQAPHRQSPQPIGVQKQRD